MSWLRVDPDLELKGMDIIKHGEAAYPAQVRREAAYTAWVTRMGNSLPSSGNKGRRLSQPR